MIVWHLICCFFLNNALLGIGLAMDAFSVSLANGLAEPNMHRRRRLLIAGTFAFFQFAMPLTGWLLVSFANSFFGGFSVYIPWIALLLLCFIGGKLLIDGIKGIRAEYSGEEHEDTDSTKPWLCRALCFRASLHLSTRFRSALLSRNTILYTQ